MPKLTKVFGPIRPQHLLWAVLVLAALWGLVAVDSYGMSWDEPLNSRYGRVTIQAYTGQPDYTWVNEQGVTGPAYFATAEWVAGLLSRAPGWSLIEARHYFYFLTYLFGILAFYHLVERWFSAGAALMASLALLTQPLLWGHAFINPKDIPFLTVFTLAILLGIELSESVGEARSDDPLEPIEFGLQARLRGAVEQLKSLSWSQKLGLGAGLLFCMGLLAEVLVLHHLLLPFLLEQVYHAYSGTGPALLNDQFDRLAARADTIPVLDYLWKTTRIYWGFRIQAAIAVLSAWVFYADRQFSSWLSRLLARSEVKLAVLSALCLGFLISMRLAGIMAGMIVLLVWLKRGRVSIPTGLIYAGLSALTVFATRPYFWTNPIGRFWGSFVGTGTFEWQGLVLYRGELYHSWELPWQYNPAQLVSQLSIPFLLLAAVGLLFSVAWWQRAEVKEVTMLASIWLGVPLGLTALVGFTRYDNFRQYLFLVPAVGLLVALGAEAVMDQIGRRNRPGLVALLAMAVVLPGLLSIGRLHPYQYIYANALAGSLQERHRQVELDYWCTSTAASAEYVNQVAANGDVVAVVGPFEVAQEYLRPDLVMRQVSSVNADSLQPDYALICARSNADLFYYTEWPVVQREQLGGITLSLVRQKPDDS